MIDMGIAGWLLPEDAPKLYELAYYVDGDILELYQPAVMLTHPKARGVVRSTLTRDAPGPR